MKRKLNKAFAMVVATFVFAATLLLNVEKNEKGHWSFTVQQSFARSDSEAGGSTGTSHGTYKDWWHTASTSSSYSYKLKPSNPATSAMTSSSGNLTIPLNAGGTIGVSAGQSGSYTYQVTTTHYACSHEWFSTFECFLKEEYTIYVW